MISGSLLYNIHTFVIGANHGVPREAGEVPAGAHAETILGPLQRPSLVHHPGDEEERR